MENYKLDNGFIYNDSFTEKEFYDAVIKNIRNDSMAPSYIFDEMVIISVDRINVPLFLTDGKSDIEYTRMIGYDSLETTTKTKTTTYGNGFQNKTHFTSTRTITNWEKDSGTLSGTAKSGTYDDKYKIYDEYIKNHKMDKSNISQMPAEELNKYSLTPTEVEFLKNDIMTKVFENNITYPGHHVKNEEYYGETTLYNSSVTIVSMYSITLKVRDKKLLFVAISNGDIEIKVYGEYPCDNFEDMFAYNREVTKERLEATKKERLIVKLSILSGIALFILLLVLGLSLNILALTIISFVVLALGIGIAIKFGMDVKKISKPYYEKIKEHNKNDLEKKEKDKEQGYQNYIKRGC